MPLTQDQNIPGKPKQIYADRSKIKTFPFSGVPPASDLSKFVSGPMHCSNIHYLNRSCEGGLVQLFPSYFGPTRFDKHFATVDYVSIHQVLLIC